MNNGDLVRIHSINKWIARWNRSVPTAWLRREQEVERLSWVIVTSSDDDVIKAHGIRWFPVRPSGDIEWTHDLIEKLGRNSSVDRWWYVPEISLRSVLTDPIDTASQRDVVAAIKTHNRRTI